jgi:hypothetical protein
MYRLILVFGKSSFGAHTMGDQNLLSRAPPCFNHLRLQLKVRGPPFDPQLSQLHDVERLESLFLTYLEFTG